jgi:hypothetical protein
MRRALLLPCSLMATAGFAASANAATLTLACAGKGQRTKDSSGQILCAGGLKGRTIAGTVKNDAGQPVAGKVTVTFSSWKPAKVGAGFNVEKTGTKDVVAKANGTFAITVNPATRQSLAFDLQPDSTLGIAGGAHAEAEVSRQLMVKVTKLGGGKIRLTVTGTSIRPVKAYVLDASGYRLPGVSPKNIDRKGQATFNVGSRRGTLSYFVDAGKLDDLFWYHSSTKFHL